MMFNGWCHVGNWGSFGNWGVWGWVGFVLNLVFWVGLLVGLTLLVIRAARGARTTAPTGLPASGQSTAKEILQARYARGEITREQFQQMLVDLR